MIPKFSIPRFSGILTLLTAMLMIFAGAIATSGRLEWLEKKDSTEERFPPVLTHTAEGDLILNTTEPGKDIGGFSGRVPLEITIRDSHISSIKVLENSETPSFLSRAEDGILPRFIGKTVAEALRERVDAVSGATYSSNAIIGNINAGLQIVNSESINRTTPLFSLSYWIGLIVVLSGAILPLFFHSKGYRYIQLIANVAVLGFWTGTFLSFSFFLRTASHGLDFLPSIAMIVMLICAFIYPLFGHLNHYCLWICPFGSLQDLASGLTAGKHIKIGEKLTGFLMGFRKVIWLTLMLLLWTGIWETWTNYELFSAFLYSSVSLGVMIAACIFIILSLFIPRAYCRFVCPTGSLFKYSENEKI